MRKNNSKIPQYVKESQENRHERVSCGISFRPSIFKDKTKYTRKKKHKNKEESS